MRSCIYCQRAMDARDEVRQCWSNGSPLKLCAASEENMADQGEVEFEGAVVRASSLKALQVELADETVVWVPRSLISDNSEVYDDGHEGTLVIPEWWAVQEGLV